MLVVGLAPATSAANGQFGFDGVAEMAKKLAAEPFRAPKPIPEFLTSLSYDDYRDIRFDTKQSFWRSAGNFQIQLIHPGLFYGHAVKINTIEGSGARPLPFSPSLFTYGRNKFADKIPADLGFAGFRVTYPFFKQTDFNHVIVFAGASYFRAVAKGQGFGLSARGLAIDTGLPGGEEFPFFKEFWLERPARDAREIKLYALLDSPSVTGAYAFVVQPGERTIVNVRTRLFLRKPVRELGIAPLTSMFLYGEERPRPADDWRPDVHDSDGLLMHSSSGEWLWRPLGNPEKLRVSYFEFDNPRGFGLLQRDRQFKNYEDLETRLELRPNAWITPVGNWGKGHVKLVEIPSRKETNDNIVSYWMPRSLPPIGQPFELAYRMHFQSNDPIAASSGRVTAMRIGNGDREDWKRIVVDFEGENFKALPDSAPVKAVISVGQDGQLVQQSVFRNVVTQGWRLSFQIKAPKGKALELRAFLQQANNTLSETWSYQIEP
ncbi:MAG TPA: glucan biosynthesis protein G [Candidatus Deferrimicrobium sp.]|nr:glucan biosynthesis protein G [Candidatus Deferrimicrobium sp.]